MSELKQIAKDAYKLSLNTHKRTEIQIVSALHAIAVDLNEISIQEDEKDKTIQLLANALKEAANTLDGCRYSEIPMAKKSMEIAERYLNV